MSALLANQKIEHTASTSTALGVKDLVSRLEGRISMAGNLGRVEKISTGIQSLDDLMGGGLEVGGVSEWGMPAGNGARFILVKLLQNLTNQEYAKPVLWTLGQPGVKILASGWMSLGINLNKLLFAKSFKPICDLREAFLEPVFSLLVFDCPKNLSREEHAFISKQAMKMKVHVCILQNYFLTGKKGNVWAKSRINCSNSGAASIAKLELTSIKGPNIGKQIIDMNEVLT